MSDSGISPYLQRGQYPSFACPICGANVRPFSRSQKTCGGLKCGDVITRQARAKREAKRKAAGK